MPQPSPRELREIRDAMDVDPRSVTISECRPPGGGDFGPEWIRQEIARLRCTKSTGTWARAGRATTAASADTRT